MLFSPPNMSAIDFRKSSRTSSLARFESLVRRSVMPTKSILSVALIARSSSGVPFPVATSPVLAIAVSLPALTRSSANATNLLNW